MGYVAHWVYERVSIRPIKREPHLALSKPFSKNKIICRDWPYKVHAVPANAKFKILKIISPAADGTILPLSNIAPGIREPIKVPFEFYCGPDMCAFEVGERMREAQQKIRDAFWIEIKDLIEERKPFLIPNKKNFAE